MPGSAAASASVSQRSAAAAAAGSSGGGAPAPGHGCTRFITSPTRWMDSAGEPLPERLGAARLREIGTRDQDETAARIAQQALDLARARAEAREQLLEGEQELRDRAQELEPGHPLERAQHELASRRGTAAGWRGPPPPPGAARSLMNCPSRKPESRRGASRKSSAWAAGGVSSTTRSKRPSAHTCRSFSVAEYSRLPASASERLR